MNLPNRITLVRLFLIPVFAVLFLVPFPYHTIWATAAFAIASLTDFLDGYLARKLGLVTRLGNFLDTIADKALVACALVLAVTLPTRHTGYSISVTAFAVIMIVRELMMACLRLAAAVSKSKVVISADKIGKVKATVQFIALIFYLPFVDIATVSSVAGDVFFYAGFALLALAAALSLVSAVNYFVRNRFLFKEEKADDETEGASAGEEK